MHCDGWTGCDKVENIKRVNCWVHARRKFYYALKIQSDFIYAENEKVCLVSGICSSWDEKLCGRPLPAFIEAVLIPFKNVIISDRLVTVSNLFFGKNMTAEFKDIYMSAKKNGNICTFF